MQSFAPRRLRHVFALGLPVDDPVDSDGGLLEFCLTLVCPLFTVHRTFVPVTADGLYLHDLIESVFGG